MLGRRAVLRGAAGLRRYVLLRLGPTGLDVPGGNLGLPLTSLPEKLAQPFDLTEAVALSGLGLSFLGLPVLLRRVRTWSPLETTFAATAALTLCLSRLNSVVSWWGYGRTVLPLVAPAPLVAARATARWEAWSFRAIGLAWCAVGALVLPRWAAGLALAAVLVMLLPLRQDAATAAHGGARFG